MKAATFFGASLFAASVAALATTACGDSGPNINELNNMPTAGSGTSGGSSGATSVSGGTGGSSGAGMTGGSAGSSIVPQGGSAGSGGGSGPAAGTGGGGGSGGGGDIGPYADRSGPFKMMVLTRTRGYRHAGSIGTGRTMLEQIAQEQGNIELSFVGSVEGANDQETQALSQADLDAAFTAENLLNYEIIFHLNTTGDVFTDAQQQIYEDWLTQHNGAFAGVHSATDTESGWAFYSDVTGQYYDSHTSVTNGTIEFEPTMADHPAVKGLPNPWVRQEEWYKFNNWGSWSAKPGFKLLSKRTGVTEHSEVTAFMWVREWSNFRSFYTAMGHESVVFEDPQVKKHVTGGIMWAVRRGHLIK